MTPVAALASCLFLASQPAPGVVFDWQDPVGDADGPGTYSPPTDTDIRAADFDLRRFVVTVEDDVVKLEVTLGEPIRRPPSEWRTNYTPTEFTSGLYLQNIDIYVDTEPGNPQAGVSRCIPGRRVAFADGRTWKRAVVLTPQPAASSAVIESALGDEAWRVLVPSSVTTRGRTVVFRVPLRFFDERPSKAWGWSVQVSGAAWETSFMVMDRVVGTARQDAQTMPVSTTAERWMFGGAELGRHHPQVVDILVPSGATQHEVLKTFDNEAGVLARVPFVYGQPPPLLATEAAAPVDAVEPVREAPAEVKKQGWTVASVDGEIVSISGPVEGVAPMMLGQVLDAQGTVVARVVVTRVIPGGILAGLVDPTSKVPPGAKVHFVVRAK